MIQTRELRNATLERRIGWVGWRLLGHDLTKPEEYSSPANSLKKAYVTRRSSESEQEVGLCDASSDQ